MQVRSAGSISEFWGGSGQMLVRAAVCDSGVVLSSRHVTE